MNPPGSANAELRQIRPTGRGLVVAIVFVLLLTAAVVVDVPTLVPIVAGLGVPLVVGPLICRSRRERMGARPSVHLHAEPAMVPVGEKAEVCMTVAVEEGRPPPIACDPPRWVRLRELPEHDGALRVLPPYAPGTPSGWIPPARSSLVDLGPSASPLAASATVPVPTGSRGVLTLRPPRWWVHDPFGLFACAGAPTRSPVVVVYPVPVSAPAAEPGPAGPERERSATGQSSRRPALADVGELTGLRPYRPGDRLRSIHWPSRAGPGPLMVREFSPDDQRVVRIVLDDRLGVHRRRAYDAALSVTHGLIAEAGAAGWTAELVTLCGRRSTIHPSLEGAAELLPLLALLNPIPPLDTLRLGLLEAPFTVVTTATAWSTLPERMVRLGRVVTV